MGTPTPVRVPSTLGGIRTRSNMALDHVRLPVAARAQERAATRCRPGPSAVRCERHGRSQAAALAWTAGLDARLPSLGSNQEPPRPERGAAAKLS